MQTLSRWSSCRQGSQRQNVNLVNTITLRHVCDLLSVSFTLIWFIYVQTKQCFRALIQSGIVSGQNARTPAVLSWFKPTLMKWNATKSFFFLYEISVHFKNFKRNTSKWNSCFFFSPSTDISLLKLMLGRPVLSLSLSYFFSPYRFFKFKQHFCYQSFLCTDATQIPLCIAISSLLPASLSATDGIVKKQIWAKSRRTGLCRCGASPNIPPTPHQMRAGR